MSNASLEVIIQSFIQRFQKNPDNYFSGCDFQYNLYYLLKSEKEFSESYVTKDSKPVEAVHAEYPSAKRVQLHKGKGYRVWLDLVILNPDFIRNNFYQAILARDERDTKLWGENILAAFEFKYFPKRYKNNLNLLCEDCFKLSLCPEVKEKYVMVFSKYIPDFREFNEIVPKGIHLYWILPNKIESFLR